MGCKMCGIGSGGALFLTRSRPCSVCTRSRRAPATSVLPQPPSELHLSPSAISQRVRVLEKHLDSPLFERRPRSLRLTEAGQAYLPAVRDLFEDLAAATSGLFGDTDRTTLTVRVQASYASTWLAPRLPKFCAAFPHIDVHMITAIWTDALPPSEIDLDIRQGNGSWPGFRATKLHDDRAVAVYGSAASRAIRGQRDRVAGHPAPSSGARLRRNLAPLLRSRTAEHTRPPNPARAHHRRHLDRCAGHRREQRPLGHRAGAIRASKRAFGARVPGRRPHCPDATGSLPAASRHPGTDQWCELGL